MRALLATLLLLGGLCAEGARGTKPSGPAMGRRHASAPESRGSAGRKVVHVKGGHRTRALRQHPRPGARTSGAAVLANARPPASRAASPTRLQESASAPQPASGASAPGAQGMLMLASAPVESALPPLETALASSGPSAEVTADVTGDNRAELSGYIISRYLQLDQDGNALLQHFLPSSGGSQGFIEANIQPRAQLLGGSLKLVADLSFAASVGLGTETFTPLIMANEAYVDWKPASFLSVVAGRHRLTWGSGLALNPSDLLNPPLNPIAAYRPVGAFLLPLLEAQLGRVTLSAAARPTITLNEWSAPTAANFKQPLIFARLYTLVAEADVNVVYYRDTLNARHAVGASVSRYLGTSVEVHAEGLVRTGPPDPLPIPTTSLCGPSLPASQARWTASGVTGMRLDGSDHTVLGMEYFYNGQGLSPGGYQVLVDQLPCTRELISAPPADTTALARPADFPLLLLRQHYLFVTFQRPELLPGPLENVGVQSTLVYGPADGSLAGQVRVQYKWGRATVGASATVWGGPDSSEFTLVPVRVIAMGDVKLNY